MDIICYISECLTLVWFLVQLTILMNFRKHFLSVIFFHLRICSPTGIKFISNSGISEFLPQENDSETVAKVKLLDGTILDADIVVVGIGSNFNTEWLTKSGLKMPPDGTLEVNEVND